jgi:hypothetical protein
VLSLVLALAAGAAGPFLGLPPWPLAPDGELVAAPPGVPLEAAGATVEPVAPGLWRVIPAEGARSVELKAGGAAATAPVEPPPGQVTITVEPSSLVKGRDARAAVELEVRTAAAELDAAAPPPRVTCSAGQLGPIEPAGPGRFRAAFELPASRHPEVVAFLAVVGRCPTCATPRAVGAAWLALPAAIDLPGRSDPGVAITVEVGGRRWGPARADGSGRFRVPVIVPPGAGRAVAHSVNALGTARRTDLELGLPTVPRVACAVEPPRLPADGHATASVTCTVAAPDGKPRAGGRLELEASRGTVTAIRWEGGLARATYRAPRGGAGGASLTVRWPEAGAAGRLQVPLTLTAGAPAAFEWRVAGEPLRPGEAAPATAVALDERGDPLGPAVVDAGPGSSMADGRLVARADLGDGVQRIALAFALPPAPEAARLSLRQEGGAWVAEARGVDGRPAEGVPLSFAGGAAAVTDARGAARVPAAGPAGWVTGPSGLRAAGWSWAAPAGAPIALAGQAEVALRPAGSVDVAAAVEGRWLRWVVRGPAGPVPGRRVVLRAGGVQLGPPQPDGDGGRCEVRGGEGAVAVVDEESGAAAVVAVR